jgi:oxygen-independent coproporphyrinogen-3 oxidase
MKKTGLYIHVPFCIQKCAYCDFYSQTDLQSADRFVSSICTHIRLLQNSMKDRLFDTVYMGGGTPSLLSCSQMKQLQDAFRSCFHFADSCEFTIEANPATLDEKKLEAYRQIGINRLSIGLQSAYDGELKKLSRVNNYADFLESYQLARKAGFENISVDLMYGIPDQSVESLLSGLETVCQLKPQHISLYGLKIEKNTFFGRM